WCSWNKRKALFQAAAELRCNKLALGHHKDDIVETVLMNIFFHGAISAMCPRQELFKGEITIIRPLCYVNEAITAAFTKDNKFPAKLCKCPFGKNSKRKQIKELLKNMQQALPETDIKENIFKGIAALNIDNTQTIKEGNELLTLSCMAHQ
ncbi:MAG: ATP-binding protein, partial [Candidatus Omnitrophica bacterium]|nr:ATP-binding protein [Candidatus Omnitrophota bacterium]